jgi:5-formyltetrahydrofolate cyclo-ligase
MTKAELRKIYLAKRIALSDTEYNLLNQQLCENFFASMDLSLIQVLHTFLPIEKTKEPNTWLIIDRIKKEYPHINISIPKINNQTSIVDNFYFKGADQLEKNTWGIPEPKQGVPTPTEKIDAVLVPLLAFDKNGNRIGYGRGFYDKFLATCREDCKKIGLSFFSAVDGSVPVAEYDIPVDYAITPQLTLQTTR